MEGFKINYNGGSDFQGIWIPIQRLEEGIEYVHKNKIVDVFIWSNGSYEKQNVNFEFLEKLHFLKSFHFAVDISQQSNISGIYKLEKVTDLAWNVSNEFSIDFSKFPNLEKLNINHTKLMTGFTGLTSLKHLYIQSIKTTDLSLIQGLNQLRTLNILRGNLVTLKGIEDLPKLEEVELRYLSKLTDLEDITSNSSVNKLTFEACKRLTDYSKLVKSKTLKFLSVFSSKIDSIEFVKDMKSIEYLAFSDLIDGNLTPLIQSRTLSKVAFYPKKKHYSHDEEDINIRLKGK